MKKIEETLTATEILGKASYNAKQLRISMGTAFINNSDEGMNSIMKIKQQAIQRLNQLEKMINDRIDQGVSNILQHRSTIQQNPFFKKKKPFKGLHDLGTEMKRKNTKTKVDQVLDVMRKENLIKSHSITNKRLQHHRDANIEKKKRDRIMNQVQEYAKQEKRRGKSSKNRRRRYNQRFNEAMGSGFISSSCYSNDSRVRRFNGKKNTFRIKGRGIKKKVSRAKFIPKDIRKGNPFADLPVIKDDDLRDGIYNLVNQGFIPKEVDVEPILSRENGILNIQRAHAQVLDHRFDEVQMHKNYGVSSLIDNITAETGLRNSRDTIRNYRDSINESGFLTEPNHIFKIDVNPRLGASSNPNSKYSNKKKEMDPMREAIDPQDLIKEQILKEVIEIEGGKVKERDPNFTKFKGKYFYMWGDVREILDKLRVYLETLGIMNVQIVTSRVIGISSLMREPSKKELTDCVDNFQMVLEASKTRKRDKMKRGRIEEKAARLIQTAYKRTKKAMVYLRMLLDTKKKLARIQKVVKIWYKYRKTKKLIRKIKEGMCNEYIDMNQRFMQEWEGIKNTRRVEIHMNSLGYDRFQKLTISNFKSAQNSQLSRIFRLIDPNVEIIYVTPFDVQLEVLSYYVKILDILGIPNVSDRVHLITPENASFFEKNYLSITNLLYYSPKAVNRIISIVGEKPSYIVGGYPSFDDVKLALKLGCPYLTGNPFINKKYINKFEAKKLFEKKGIPVSIHSNFISDSNELVNNFTEILLRNPEFNKWEFNIVDEFHGRGKAVFRTELISIMNEVRICESYEDRIQYQDILRDLLRRFLPSNLNISCPRLFRNFSEYKSSFLTCGGVIEVLGQGENYLIGAQYHIEPDGRFKYMTSFEVLQNSYGKVLGYVCPQAHIPENVVMAIGKKVCRKIFEEGILGYVSIYIAIRIKALNTLKMTVKSIEPYYNEFLGAYGMFSALNSYDDVEELEESQSFIDSEHQDAMKIKSSEKNQRKFIVFPRIDGIRFPERLNYIQFFDDCRKQGIYYDILKKSGTVFLLSDEIQKGSLGLMIIDSSFRQVIKYASKAVTYIGNLKDSKEGRGDGDRRANIIECQNILDLLYRYQKKID